MASTISFSRQLDRAWTLKQLTEAGYGSRETLNKAIRDEQLVARKIGGVLRVTDSDLRRYLDLEDVATSPVESVATPVTDLGDLTVAVVAAFAHMTGVERRGILAQLDEIAQRTHLADA